MPIQLPVLDDRSYRDFLEEARPLYAQFSKNWTNHNPSDPGVTLTELFAVLSEAALYRLDRITPAMRRRTAVLCTPPAQTARVDLEITFTDTAQFQTGAFTLFFPKNLWFSADGRRFAVARDTTFRWPEDAVHFSTEKEGIDYTRVSLKLPVYNYAEYPENGNPSEVELAGYDGSPVLTDGSANQEIPLTFLSGRPLIYSVEMFDPGNTYRWGPPKLVLESSSYQEEWAFQPDLLQSSPSDQHFTIDYHWGSIKFGDGVNGSIPPQGCKVILSEIKITDGRDGSVRAAREWNVRDELDDLEWGGEEKIKDDLQTGTLKLSNPARSTEGEAWVPMQDDTDRLAFLEDRATQFRRKRYRAVTREDFEELGKQAHQEVGRIAAVANFNGDSSAGGERVEENAVTLFTVLKSGAESDREDVVKAVREFVQPRALLTTRVYAAPISTDKLRLRLRIAFDSSIAGDIAFNRIRTIIRDAVERYFDPVHGGLDGKGLIPGEALNRAELYTLVERIDGVDFVEDIAVSVLSAGGSRFGIPVLVPKDDDAESVEIVRVLG